MAFPITLFAEDEYGVEYIARTFQDIEELHDEMKALDELLDEASPSRAYVIRQALAHLEQLAYEEDPLACDQ
jgi:hypothetical protein